jgi:hypothetical protein
MAYVATEKITKARGEVKGIKKLLTLWERVFLW